MSKRSTWLLGGALTILGGLLVLSAYWLLWTTFMVYDDEGYVLWSLRTFAEGGRLYEEVYSQYGPFFFLFNRALHVLGVDFTNTAARALTLCYWIGTGGLCGALVWQQTRSAIATFAAFGGVFVHLWPMVAEPSHPGGLICLLVALIAWAGAQPAITPRRLAAIVGALGAALALTKINIGVFVLASAGAWGLLNLRESKLQKWAPWIAAGMLALLPWVLMRKLDAPWARTFAWIDAAAGVSVVFAAGRTRQRTVGGGELAALAAAAAAVALVTSGLIVASGTSIRALVEGVVLAPLRHPSIYSLAFTWHSGSLPIALAGVAMAGWLAAGRGEPRGANVVFLARLLVAAAYLWCMVRATRLESYGFALSFGLGTAWLFVLPARSPDATKNARAWLALLLVPQALHAFPVAGSQISWGTFLWAPLVALGLHEACSAWKSARIRILIATGAVALLATTTVRYTRVGWNRYRASDALGLLGAERLRLPERLSSALRILVRNSAAHADPLFSLPGMQSFHLWSGVPPPTTANATHWFNLLSSAQQDAILEKLAASPRSGVIVQRYVHDFLVQREIPIAGTLADWLRENYAPAFRLESYEFWVRKNRPIAPIGTATLLESTAGGMPRHKIEIVVAAEAGPVEIAAVELRRLDGDSSRPIPGWLSAGAAFSVTPLAPSGKPLAAPSPRPLPLAVSKLTRLDVYTDAFPADLPVSRAILYLRDPHGNKCGEARFVD